MSLFVCAAVTAASWGRVHFQAGESPSGVDASEVSAALSRTAVIDLGMRPNATTDDYLITADALWVALTLRPGDAETARLVSAAAWSAGDRELLLDATRAVIRADASDTVAQLRLISANINGRQTVAGRLEAYDRFLGAGRSLDPSIRSRLALDAALLLRETGDTAGFELRLLEAAELDATNKDAVSLAARTFSGPDASIEDVASWQIRLLYADPLDPYVHLAITRICAMQGAMDTAERFLANAIQLFSRGTGEIPEGIREEQLAMQWPRLGSREILDRLNGPLLDARNQAATAIQARREANEPTTDLREPNEIRYEPGIERIRLLAAHDAKDEDSIGASLFDIAGATDELFQAIIEQGSQPGADQVRLGGEMVRVFSEFQVVRAIVRNNPQDLRRQFDEFSASLPQAAPMLEPLKAWLAYAEGDSLRAIDLMGEPRPGTSDDLLIGLASQEIGDSSRAKQILVRYARAQALGPIGALARVRLRAMDAEGEIMTPEGRRLESALRKVPTWMDRMISDPKSYMSLQVETPASTVGPEDHARVRVRLRNTSAIPMGLGSSRPIGSRLLLAPRAVGRTSEFVGSPASKVLEVDRRLRLAPMEELDVVVEADSAYTQWLREVNASISLRDRYRVIQSFQPSPRGGLVNSPFALVSESPLIQRIMLGLSRRPFEDLIAAVRPGGGLPVDPMDDGPDVFATDGVDRDVSLRAVITATVSRTIEPLPDLVLSADQRRALAAAWIERYAASTELERALMVLKLPHARQVSEMQAFDTMVIESVVGESLTGPSKDPALLVAAMLTRVRDADSPLFEVAAQAEDGRVRRLARRLAERLADGRPTFAKAGPGTAGLASPSALPGAGP